MGTTARHTLDPVNVTRRLVVAAMLIALFAALLPVFGPTAGAQENGAGDGPAEAGPVAVQGWLCPTGYAGSDYLDDCTPGGATYQVTLSAPGEAGLTASSDGQGYVTFAGGDAGGYSLELGAPGDFASFYSACFDRDGVFRFDGTANVIDFSLAAGQTLFCRWYVIPADAGAPSASPSAAPVADAEATVQVWTCPVAYSGDDYLDDCSPIEDSVDVSLNPGAAFDQDTAGFAATFPDGFVTFPALTAGEYNLTLQVPGEFADFYYACFDTTSGTEVFVKDGDLNTLSFVIEEGGAFSCRWYIIPEDLQGAPSASPSASAAASAKPSASARPVVVLPSTGAGPDTDGGAGSHTLPLIVLLAAALAAATVIATRRPGGAR